MNLVPSAAECSYAACFCEENVWKLCDHVRTTSPNELSKAFVVFISNKKQVSQDDTFFFHFTLRGVLLRVRHRRPNLG